MESTLSFPCSRSDPPLFRQGAALAHLDSLPTYNLVLWTDGSVPFPFGKVGSDVLVNCVLALRPLFPFQHAQYVQVSRLKPPPSCKLFAGLGSTKKSAISLLFSSDLNLAPSSSPSFFLLQLLWQIWQELSSFSSCIIELQWVPRYSFLPGNDAANKLARRSSLSPLISRIHSYLFSDWRRTVSPKFCDTQVFSIFTEEVMLPRHARYALSRLYSNGHSLLLNSYLSRIDRIENSSCSACGYSFQDTSHLILHCPATDSLRHSLFGDSIRFLFQALGSCPVYGTPKSSTMPPSLGRGQVETTTTSRPVELKL